MSQTDRLPGFPSSNEHYITQKISFLGTITRIKGKENNPDSIGIFGKRIGGETEHQILVANFHSTDKVGNPTNDKWFRWLEERVDQTVYASFILAEGPKPISDGVEFTVFMRDGSKETAFFPIKAELPA